MTQSDKDQCLEILRNLGGSGTIDQIAQRMGIAEDKERVRQALDALITLNRVTNHDDRYWLT